MQSFLRRLTLINKLSLMLILAILVMVGSVGVYFEYFLKENHLESTKKRMLHGYQRLAYNLKGIEAALARGVTFIKTDEAMLASIDLVNNYQDKDHYNAILLDEEKKLIASELLSRVKLSFNSTISLYDHQQELIAWVTKEPAGYLLQFISYRNGQAVLFSRYEQEENYHITPYVPHTYVPFFHGDRYPEGEPRAKPLTNYDKQEGKVTVKSHLSIYREWDDAFAAHIELSNILDAAYFKELSENLDMEMIPSSTLQKGMHAVDLFDRHADGKLPIFQSEAEYYAAMSVATRSGPVYFMATLDKAPLNEALDQNRYQFLTLLILVAVFILGVTRYLFYKGLALPFGTVMRQIDQIEHEEYAVSEQVSTGDELEAISRNINRLAFAVSERESSLRHSQSELMATKASLQESLSEFKHLFNTTMESIVISQENRCIDINEEGIQQFGFASKAEALGKDIFEFIAPDGSREKVKEQIIHDVTFPYEANAIRPDGTVFPALLKGFNFRTARGVMRISAVIDLSEIKKSQAALEALNKNLRSEVTKQIDEIRQKDEILIQQSKHAAMGEMISNISHQWRQPLSALGLMIQDIEDAYEYGELDKKYIEKTIRESMELINYMSQTIDDFRNFFAPGDTKASFGVKEQVEAVVGLVSSRLSHHGISLEIEGDGLRIEGYPNKFKQVLINIINNAYDAVVARMKETGMTAGMLKIEIGDEAEWAVITISDNGGGIPPDIIHKVFDPYFTTKFKSQGTGIGLYMSKTIVEKNMRGELHAENTEAGARFTIRLPKRIDHS